MTLRAVSRAWPILAMLTACNTSDPIAADVDLGPGGKADAIDAGWGGTIFWGFSTDVSFRDVTTNKLVFAKYLPFELSGPAKVSLETTFHQTQIEEWNDLNRGIDTVLYVHREDDGGTWGKLLGKNDDGGTDKMSKLSLSLDAGKYRVLVARRFDPDPFPPGYEPIVDVAPACSGDGCAEPVPPPRVCDEDDDWNCVIGEAIFLASGADLRVAAPVAVDDVPADARPGVKAAVSEIEARSFPNSDYEADVEGVYEVFRSEDDDTVLAYAVLGYGSGEPDYSDAILIGIGRDGAEVFYLEESW